jgi:hypothetical protein
MSNAAIMKKWTVMVYLAGDNNLDANGVTDLKEMKMIGSTPGMNIIAQFDRAAAGLPTNRYFIQKGTSLDADVKESLGEINTGKPEYLLDFIKWGADNYPADHYMIVLWNHGQGWDDTDIFAGERISGSRLSRTNRIRHAFFKTSVMHAAKLSALDTKTARAILIDDDARDFLDSVEMKNALEDAKTYLKRKIDILGMDACLMSMAEVAYQMRNSVSYAVGSEETEPIDGWPYNTILGQLSAKPETSPRELSKIIVKKYIESYKGTGEAVTQSAFDLSVLTLFAAAFKTFAEALMIGLADARTLNLITNARNRAQEYQVNDNIDLINFCQLLLNSAVPTAIANACKGVITAVKEESGLVFSSGYNGESMNQSNGLAIYFPTRVLSPLYARLDFTKKTGWGDFLKEYIAVTRNQ